jgi:hypothetical protein
MAGCRHYEIEFEHDEPANYSTATEFASSPKTDQNLDFVRKPTRYLKVDNANHAGDRYRCGV